MLRQYKNMLLKINSDFILQPWVLVDIQVLSDFLLFILIGFHRLVLLFFLWSYGSLWHSFIYADAIDFSSQQTSPPLLSGLIVLLKVTGL